MHEQLHERIEKRTALIGVIGLGYVGLPLAAAFHGKGFNVLGLDIDESKVHRLNDGKSYVKTIPDAAVAEMRAGGRFRASADFSDVANADVVLLCVPTPLSAHREPDMTYVSNTTDTVARHLRSGQLVILESTSYPGTTAEVVKPRLEESGLKAGRDFFLAYSPEREDPGNPDFTTTTIPKVVGADDPLSFDLACRLYGQLVAEVVPVSSLATAEAVKLTENVFRAVNIALVNELKVVFESMGINIWEVIEAAKTKPFGYMPFYPGPGLGGHCIPIDPFYLTWKARQFNIATRFIELAGEINTAMPTYVVDRLAEALDMRLAKPLNGSRILVVGLAYKKNIDDMRESPALRIISLLERRSARVDYHDPHVPEIGMSRDYGELAGRRSVDLTAEQLARYEAAIICTDHDTVDYRALVENCPLVVDTRNATARLRSTWNNVIMA